jgi:hypothetical protein
VALLMTTNLRCAFEYSHCLLSIAAPSRVTALLKAVRKRVVGEWEFRVELNGRP